MYGHRKLEMNQENTNFLPSIWRKSNMIQNSREELPFVSRVTNGRLRFKVTQLICSATEKRMPLQEIIRVLQIRNVTNLKVLLYTFFKKLTIQQQDYWTIKDDPSPFGHYIHEQYQSFENWDGQSTHASSFQ